MPQMRSLRSLFSAGSDGARPKCPIAPSNRTTACTVRRTSPFTQNPHPHRPTSRIVSYSITRSIRATQIPIVRHQPPSCHFARFHPLAVFRRRPPMPRGTVRQRPASENLVWGLSVSRKNSPCTESFCHVIRLHCGTAALLLGCAERSEPQSRVRRAEGAGLDRECADRVTMSLPRRTNDFYFVGSPSINVSRLAICRCGST
jgi:hypothetical protein